MPCRTISKKPLFRKAVFLRVFTGTIAILYRVVNVILSATWVY